MLGSGNSTTSVLAVQPPPQVDAPRRQARGAFDFLFRPIAPKAWNALLYCCGGAAAACVGAYLLVPSVSELAVFASLMFFTSGPFSTFLPAASEPILVAFGKLHPPLLLASLGVVGIALAEWVNYRVFAAVLHAPRLKSVRDARLMRWATTCFNVQPFWTAAFCAFTPFPFWMARTCAVVAHYPLDRFTMATVLGRFPRIWLIALVGSALPFTSRQIAVGGVIAVMVLASLAARRARRAHTSGGLQ
jgi:membrane protein DedA with SNARE-associated domain